MDLSQSGFWVDGHSRLIAHLGYPTTSFKAPLIYNPYFRSIGLNAVVVPMGVQAENYKEAFRLIFGFSNVHGGLITMPHKVTTVSMLDEASTAVKVAGSCNAVLRRTDGSLLGDMFDGEGFARGMARKGKAAKNASALIIGSGGVGSAIAAALAGRGLARLGLYDSNTSSMDSLADRVSRHHPEIRVSTGNNDPEGYDIVINATPMGMNAGDPMPVDTSRIAPSTFVGEVVMKSETTPFLAAAIARGCQVQVGLDMLFEQIPAYLEFFGFPTTTPENLRSLAQITY
jgi:shikimate dehydrogenase